MRQMLLLMHLTPEEEVLWQGRSAMVVALDDAEAVVFRHNINAVDDVLKHQTKALATLREVFETEGDREGRSARIIADMQAISKGAEAAMDAIRVVIGRAAFVGPDQAQGVMQ
jgi:hypothetical protein